MYFTVFWEQIHRQESKEKLEINLFITTILKKTYWKFNTFFTEKKKKNQLSFRPADKAFIK